MQDQARRDCELGEGGHFGPGPGRRVVCNTMCIFYLEQGSLGRSASTKTVQHQAQRDCELRKGGKFIPGQGEGCVCPNVYFFFRARLPGDVSRQPKQCGSSTT